jgi:NAD+ synthetase
MNWKIVAENIRKELKNYLIENKLKSLVLGVSGGIDSALCAVLAFPVCKELNIPLIGRSLPIASNSIKEIERAKAIGQSFCSNFNEVDLIDQYQSFVDLTDDYEGCEESTRKEKIRKGNIKARCRMIYLYNLSQLYGGMVLSTDNLSELLLSFWTLHGDVGDYGMVQNLWKTEIYELAKYIADEELTNDKHKEALRSCIEATPTDGLGITNSDLDQLGAKSYDEVDLILQEHLFDITKHTDHPVIKRYYASSFKRNNPINLKRNIIVKNAE